jgi:hypothetical protein
LHTAGDEVVRETKKKRKEEKTTSLTVYKPKKKFGCREN